MNRTAIWLLVVGTACLATLSLTATTCWLFLAREVDAAKESAQYATAAFTATLALLARQPDSTPVPVTTTPGDSVAVEPAP